MSGFVMSDMMLNCEFDTRSDRSRGVCQWAGPPASLHLVLLLAPVAGRLISQLLMSKDRNPLGRHGNSSTLPIAAPFVCLVVF